MSLHDGTEDCIDNGNSPYPPQPKEECPYGARCASEDCEFEHIGIRIKPKKIEELKEFNKQDLKAVEEVAKTDMEKYLTGIVGKLSENRDKINELINAHNAK